MESRGSSALSRPAPPVLPSANSPLRTMPDSVASIVTIIQPPTGLCPRIRGGSKRNSPSPYALTLLQPHTKDRKRVYYPPMKPQAKRNNSSSVTTYPHATWIRKSEPRGWEELNRKARPTARTSDHLKIRVGKSQTMPDCSTGCSTYDKNRSSMFYSHHCPQSGPCAVALGTDSAFSGNRPSCCRRPIRIATIRATVISVTAERLLARAPASPDTGLATLLRKRKS
jgi:hypothetical protein